MRDSPSNSPGPGHNSNRDANSGSKASEVRRGLCRRIYGPVGFDKAYNFVLYFVLVGALMGFVLARFQYLDIDGIFLKVSTADVKDP
jgi:hypothetical protein